MVSPKSLALAMCSKSPAMRSAKRVRGKPVRIVSRSVGSLARSAFNTGAVCAKCPKPCEEISTKRWGVKERVPRPLHDTLPEMC